MKNGTAVRIVAAYCKQDFKPSTRGAEKYKHDEKSYIGMFKGKSGVIESVDTYRYPVRVRFRPAVTFSGEEQYQRFGFSEVEFNG